MASNQAVQAIECNINLQSECAGSFAFMPSGKPLSYQAGNYEDCLASRGVE